MLTQSVGGWAAWIFVRDTTRKGGSRVAHVFRRVVAEYDKLSWLWEFEYFRSLWILFLSLYYRHVVSSLCR